MFAVDFAATTWLTGSLFNYDGASFAEYGDGKVTVKEKGTVKGPSLNKQNQKDTDGLIFSVNGDKAGASVNFFYEAGSEAAVNARNVKIWFKPIDQLKVTIGQVSGNFYVDRLTWWKAVTGDAWKNVMHSYSGYSSRSAVDGWGVLAEFNPISALTIHAGFTPAAGDPIFSSEDKWDATDKKTKNTTKMGAWGVGAKYQITDQISAGVSYLDDGFTTAPEMVNNEEKVVTHNGVKMVRIGGDFGNWGTPYYCMVNAVLRFEEYTQKDAKEAALGLAAIAIDNYWSYKIDALNLQARFPVVLRMTNLKGGRAVDPNYFIYDVKASYQLDDLGVYCRICSDELAMGKIAFGAGEDGVADVKIGDTFCMQIKPGVTFNVGSCAFDIGAAIDILPKGIAFTEKDPKKAAGNAVNFSIPFKAEVKF
jgi:hypothetical protein